MATTWNPSDKAASVTLSSGNLVAASSSVGGVRATNSLSGLNYFEVKVVSGAGPVEPAISVLTSAVSLTSASGGNGVLIYDNGANFVVDNTAGSTLGTFAGTIANGDIFGIAFDATGLKLYVARNGTWVVGNPAAGTGGITLPSGTYFPATFLGGGGGSGVSELDADTTTYSPPSGYTIIGGGGGGSTYTLTADRGIYTQAGVAADFPNLVSKATYKSAANGSTTATIPSHVAGDLLIAYAFRDGNATAPSLPAGWTSILTQAGTTCSLRVGYKFAASSSETSGTWTNATELEIAVYSGVDRIGASASQAGTAASVTYPALTMQFGNSWVSAGAGHRSLNTTLETPPTGMTLRDNRLDATAETAVFDANGLVATFTARSVNVGGTASGWCAASVELVPRWGGAAASNSYALTAASGAYAQTGQATGLRASRQLTAAPGSYSQSGQAAALRISKRLAADTGSYLTAGQAAGLRRALRLVASPGAYAQTGQSALLKRVLALVASSGIYLQSGQATGLKASRRLVAAGGAYAQSGYAARLIVVRRFAAEAGAYVVDGKSIDMVYSPIAASYLLSAVPGAYATSGFAVALKTSRRLAAGSGNYTLVGKATILRVQRKLIAQAGQYQTNGQAVILRSARRFPVQPGHYATSGQPIGIFLGHRLAAEAGAYTVQGSAAQIIVDRVIGIGPGAYAQIGSAVDFIITMLPPPAGPKTRLNSSISTRSLLVSALMIEHRLRSSIAPPHRLKGRI